MKEKTQPRPAKTRVKIILILEPFSEELTRKYSRLSEMGFDATFWTSELAQVSRIEAFKPYGFMPHSHYHEAKKNEVEIEIPKTTFYLLEMGARALSLTVEDFIPFLCQYLHCSSSCQITNLPNPSLIEVKRDWWNRAGSGYQPDATANRKMTELRRNWWRKQHRKQS